jgi:hypothetical protein
MVRQTRAQFSSTSPEGSRGFISASLRHTVCSVWLHAGDGPKSAPVAAFVRLMRTGERDPAPDWANFSGLSPSAEKPVRFMFRTKIRSSIASVGSRRVSSQSRSPSYWAGHSSGGSIRLSSVSVLSSGYDVAARQQQLYNLLLRRARRSGLFHALNSSRSALASFRSAVSKPSVNQL